MCAVAFTVQIIADFRKELQGAFCPITIAKQHVFTDSMVCLNWLTNKAYLVGKIERKGVLLNNKLDLIAKLSKDFPVNFHYVGGMDNPADCVTRCMSSKVLNNRNNYCLAWISVEDPMLTMPCLVRTFTNSVNSNSQTCDTVLPLEKFSEFKKLCNVSHYVGKFIYNLKQKVSIKKNIKMLSNTPLLYKDTCVLYN